MRFLSPPRCDIVLLMKQTAQHDSRFRVRLGIFAAMFSLAVSACQTIPSAPFPHMLEETVTPDYLFHSLVKRQAALVDLKSFTRTAISKSDSSQSFKQAFMIKGGDSIRVETLGLLGQPLGIFIHDKEKTLLYDPKQNRTFKKAEVRAVMQQIVGTALDFDEFIGVFSGNVPRLAFLKLHSARLDAEKKIYHLEAADTQRGSRFQIALNALTLEPVRLVKTINGQTEYVAEWEDYRKVGDYPFPHRIVLSRPASKETLTVKFDDPQINSGISQSVFQLAVGG